MHVDLVGDKHTAMPTIDSSVDSLRVWNCRYRTLAPIGSLRRLKTLVTNGFPDDSFGILTALKGLRLLCIVHLPRVRDLSPRSLAALAESRSLVAARFLKYPKAEVKRFYEETGVADDYRLG